MNKYGDLFQKKVKFLSQQEIQSTAPNNVEKLS